MTTIINTPPVEKESGQGVGIIISLVALVIVAYLFVMFGWPAIKRVQVGAPQINVPSQIDVNINQPNE